MKKPEPIEFLDMLENLSRGTVLMDAERDLNKVVAAVVDSGKAGSLSIKLSVKPEANGLVSIRGSVTPNAPKSNHMPGIYFVGAAHELYTDDPRQGKLFEEEEDAPRPVAPGNVKPLREAKAQ